MKKYFGIIGNPIKHSLSPVLHNYWFKKYGINADYTLIDIKQNEISELVQKIRKKEIFGINITLPYKQKIVPYVDLLVKDALLTSSVNTLYLDEKSSVVGDNTDVFGLQAAYLKEVDRAPQKKALVIGAGGVSPSVILSLQKSGVQDISITNRTMEKCIFLKKKFKNINILEWQHLKDELKKYDIIINATSLGLKNNNDFEFDFEPTKKDLIYIDTIYNPLETRTLKFLKDKDIKVFNGLEMFIYQGQKAFYLWNKVNPEIDQKLVDLLISKLK